ncbi:MAG: putative toxin-antitoxin system toxin component, PIN family [Candidatus Viridilinea halotolerans]|uniref:Putative toxin-antitoxin system toxin component, PIN family n=1 Tax=Candidatus Viridilinea halotolerans TaxID=2491704 RepID=A0A426U7M1_9CHLR|nr:MAG: putative toxin-antitoxin system toxin component, PIN family [Candidatus Viridilinea halotolerans]
MRVVLDTNIAISGLLWRGAPRRVINAAIDGQIELFSSVELLDELEEVLQRPKLAARLGQIGKTSAELVDEYGALVAIVAADPLVAPVSTDPDDDAVLACALAARAEAIVSGDDDLLTLQVFQAIPILTASAFLMRLAPAG